MDFRGHLRLPEDAGTGIPVLLRLDDIFVVISSGDDELGTWRADDVVIERIFSNQFAIELDGESMVFVAQDALGFAYDGISAIEDLQERLTKRRVFKRSKKKPAPVDAAAPRDEPAAETPSQPEATDEVLVDEPVDEPVLAAEPKAIWSPPVAAASPPAATEPDFELAVPEPIQRRVEAESSDPAPADVRVSYPRPSAPSPPAAESFAPPSTTPPESKTEEHPSAGDVPDQTAPAPVEPQSTSERMPSPGAPEEVDPTPVSPEPPESVPSTDEPQFEIEEVSAAATGVGWADDATVEAEVDEPAIEIEEYVPPTAGAADLYTAHAGPIEDEAPPEHTAPGIPEESDASEEDGEALEPESPAVEEPAALAESTPAEGKHVAEDPGAPAVEEAAASNGHSKTDVGSQESTKRERRHSLFGRSRDKKVPPHDHQYGDPKTIGGLTRQVCEVCGHVTFSGEDVYQGW